MGAGCQALGFRRNMAERRHECRRSDPLEIEKKGDLWDVRVWAKCVPEDCDWGQVPLHVMGDAIGNDEPQYGLAHWDQGFASQHMVVRLEGEEMAIEFFTVFQDGSGRSNCRSVYRVCRAD